MANATPRKIKVTFVLPSFAGGGAERVVLTLMRHLDPARFTPHLIVLNGEGPLRDSVSGNISVTDLRQPRLRRHDDIARRRAARGGERCRRADDQPHQSRRPLDAEQAWAENARRGT